MKEKQILPDYDLEFKTYETYCSSHLAPKYIVDDIPESLNRIENSTIKLPMVMGPVCTDYLFAAYLFQWSNLVGVS